MNRLEEEVAIVLAVWNPIEVDGAIALHEYLNYVKPVIAAMKADRLRGYLVSLLNDMGLNYDDEMHGREIDNLTMTLLELHKRSRIESS